MRTPLLLLLLAVANVWAATVIYPNATGEALNSDYDVSIQGRKVEVFTARVLDPPFAGKEWNYGGPYAFANFDTDGKVEVRITSRRSLANVVIRPESAGATIRTENANAIVVSLPGPRKVSIEPDGKNSPLLLFANPMETAAPQTNAPGVVYYGPGTSKPGRIVLTNNQTLYLAGGAVVKGGILAEGNNIRICGRGILDSSDWEWRKGPTPHVVSIKGTNIEVSGITIRGASHWTVVPRDSTRVVIQDVKICGGRVQNDDGINPCNSRQVVIRDCFIRTDDDCVAMKGLVTTNGNVEQVTVENCTLWCDRARIFLLGHESRAPFMRDISLRNLDIIHFTMTPFLFEPGEEMRLQDVKIEDVRIHGEGQRELARLKPVVNQYMRTKLPGHISGVAFRNITLSGAPGLYRVQIIGADPTYAVDGVSFENVSIIDEKLTRGSSRLQLGQFSNGISFQP